MNIKLGIIVLFMSFFCETAVAQNSADTLDAIALNDSVKTIAQYPGGQEAMYQFIGENLTYPPMAFENEIEGKVIVQFLVNTDGTISNIETLGKKLGWGCEEAAILVIKKMPNFIPASSEGIAVPVRYRIPINFEIEEGRIRRKKRK